MHQWLATDLGVDKRHHHTELDQPEPAVEELRTVLHGNRAHIPGAQALGVKHMGHAIGLGFHGGVGDTLLAVDQKRPIGECTGLPFKTVGQGIQVRRFDLAAGRRTQIQQCLGLITGHGLLSDCRQSADAGHVVHGATASASG